jgi:hypothetical protein
LGWQASSLSVVPFGAAQLLQFYSIIDTLEFSSPLHAQFMTTNIQQKLHHYLLWSVGGNLVLFYVLNRVNFQSRAYNDFYLALNLETMISL